MYTQTIRLMIGALLTQLIFCVLIWDEIDHVYVVSWYALIIILSGLRVMLYLMFDRDKNWNLDLSFWSSAFIFLAFLFSVTMGSLSVIVHLTHVKLPVGYRN